MKNGEDRDNAEEEGKRLWSSMALPSLAPRGPNRYQMKWPPSRLTRYALVRRWEWKKDSTECCRCRSSRGKKLHPAEPAGLPPRQAPRIGTHDLALTEAPEIDAQADEVVDARVGALVEEQGGEGAQGVDGEAGLDAAVHGGFGEGEDREGPFPGEGEEAEEEVQDLEDGDGADGGVEIGGEEVPEDFGPEESFEGGGDLVCGFGGLVSRLWVWKVGRQGQRTESGGEDDETGPVVFDELAHLPERAVGKGKNGLKSEWLGGRIAQQSL